MRTATENAQKKLILLELNEVNFDVARYYVHKLGLENFRRIFDQGLRNTISEDKYHKLEPWIQWVSAHSGLTADQHKIYRLGDIVAAPHVSQIFEAVEARGYSVGCISPMNAENRLVKPLYFIPDPWTKTETDGSIWSNLLSSAISQAVNDNAQQKLTIKSLLVLLAGLARFAKLKNYYLYLSLAFKSLQAPWCKALFLDLFLHDLHITLFRKYAPNFSTLFLNAGAHIQHHYFFNAVLEDKEKQNLPEWYVSPNIDPMAEMFKFYDGLLGDFFNLAGTELIVATGLTQAPYDRIKFYYRLKEHGKFLQAIGVSYLEVQPRMTRDFLITFNDEKDANAAADKIRNIRMSGTDLPIFSDLENRGTSLFVTLTYPHEIKLADKIHTENGDIPFLEQVAFVAIKNGMHDPKGYVFFSDGVEPYAFEDGAHVGQIYHSVANYFEQIAIAEGS